jgi:hypothetical protein
MVFPPKSVTHWPYEEQDHLNLRRILFTKTDDENTSSCPVATERQKFEFHCPTTIALARETK